MMCRIDRQPDKPRFLVDENAARLTRWLRLLGYDAVYMRGVDDALLVERARTEGRVLLTRDRGMMARRPIAGGEVEALLLWSDDTWVQLEQTVRNLRLDPFQAPFTRCASCNHLLEPVSAEAARPHVPPFVAATQQHFTRCRACQRFYWRGTHWQRVTARLSTLLPPSPA